MFGLGGMELAIIIIILLFSFLFLAAVIWVVKKMLGPKKSDFLQHPSTRLKELQKLKDDDVITEDEFNQKRKEILNEL